MKRKLDQIQNILTRGYKKTSKRLSIVRTKTLNYIDHRPLKSFFIALGIVLVLIVISNLIPKPVETIPTQTVTKKVDVYHIGSAPKVTVQAQIQKSGVIQIVAQTPGIISFINVTEGTKVTKGQQLLGIASNYYGGNSATISRQIAQTSYDAAKENYPSQKENIQKQKDIVNKTDENSDQMRDIQNKTNDDTKSLIDLNQQLIDAQDAILNDPSASTSDKATAKGTKASLLNALNQARAALRSGEYNAAGDKPPAQISDLTREKTLKDLDVQQKQLDLNLELSRLQLLVAQTNEAQFYPAAPFSGVVERVYVKQFEAVNPGTPLILLSQTVEDDPITAIALVSKDIASRVSTLEPSILHIGDKTEEATPIYVSTEAVQGSLYAVYYPIPDSLNKDLTNAGYISVDIPVGSIDSLSSIPFAPIDAIYQTRSTAYLFVKDGDIAKSKEVKLGQVFGRFVEITEGLTGSDSVILNRNVIEGDRVQTN